MINPFVKLKETHRNLYALIVGMAIILYWRGIWGLADVYMFPENQAISFAVSAIVGILLLFINDFKLDEIERD
ncbi:MAG: hypothetical protein HOE19_02510 [Candidatus Komeilibacteria bacterium]|jgi:hypothetical protein|nr:hypothetical protein [Candidatus Komeilibacteria bacterium]MBT4447282.1 hypothetical protein [Candidatus Komeilibacteria bacterium]